MVSNRIIYWKFKESLQHMSYNSIYNVDWFFDIGLHYRERLSWDSMYIMDGDDKITINGYYCME